MRRLVLTRALDAIPVLLGVTTLAFLLIHLVPGDPAHGVLGPSATPAQLAAVRRRLGLDEPLLTQYWHFLRGIPTLDFGRSFTTGDSVASDIGRHLVPSLLLTVYALILALLFSVPLAAWAAARRGKWSDHTIRVLSSVFFVIPSFWLGLLLIQVVSIKLGLLPTSGYGKTMPQHLEGLTLPALTVALSLTPVLVRQLRASIIETSQAEFVEAARARGLGELRVMAKHVMRNSAMSTVTLIGILAGVMMSLVLVVENVFSIPGLGTLAVNSVSDRDLPVVQALTLVLAVAVVVSNFLADVAYAVLDPRVRL